MTAKVLFAFGDPPEITGRRIEDPRLTDRLGLPVVVAQIGNTKRPIRVWVYLRGSDYMDGKLGSLLEGESKTGEQLGLNPMVKEVSFVGPAKEAHRV